MIRVGWFVLLVSLAGSGCLSQEVATTLVPLDPFQQHAAQRQRVAYGPASIEAAARVESVGQKLLAANPQTNLRPVFRTIGSPQPEIFHVGTVEVDVTEGLVNQCRSDGELAGALAYALGAMLAEREVVAWPNGRMPHRQPSPALRVGNDQNSLGETPDMTRLAELGKHEKENGGPQNAAAPRPDPRNLARGLLVRAGYRDQDLDAAMPLVKSANTKPVFETQFSPRAGQ
jgi:hypothetical protein